MSQDHTVFIVDDDEAVRDSLQVLLESAGYRTEAYESGAAFLEACDDGKKGCVLLDVRMPKISGLEVQESLQADRPDLAVVIMTGHGDIPMAVRAMKSGAVDFVEKPFQEDSLFECVEIALSAAERAEREGAINAETMRKLERLTPRERDVLEKLVIGQPNKVIAYEFNCSPRTVEIHRARIMEKMEARSLPHLVRMALAAGIDPDRS